MATHRELESDREMFANRTNRANMFARISLSEFSGVYKYFRSPSNFPLFFSILVHGFYGKPF
jgi:hypothetical protein